MFIHASSILALIKTMKLQRSEFEATVRKPAQKMSKDEVAALLESLDASMCSDCEQLILNEIALWRGKSLEQLKADNRVNPNVINNALILLTEAGRTSTALPVILEVLSQTDDFLSFNEIAVRSQGWTPIDAAIFAFGDTNNEQLREFLLRGDVTIHGKDLLLQGLCTFASTVSRDPLMADIRQDILAFVSWLLPIYLADVTGSRMAERKEQRSGSRLLLSRLADIAACAGLKELAPKILPLYAQNLIDETICSELEATDGFRRGGFPEMNPPSQFAEDWLG